ncbi:unnamed protein product [Anisakis simplex]|uniref:Neur_chan_LBD domain-containing protein n=1 Tax=Anisakis simplex TaxID=6269 RepID=A0A0M3K344_ANISI|nr:unnamed protein product [Anisakis simplex]
MTNETDVSEKDLINWLLHEYDKRIRPVRNWTTRIEVTIQPQIYSLVDVDELREQITLLLWIPHSWKDEYLHWNPSEWGGITRVNVPADELWLPDGTIFNMYAHRSLSQLCFLFRLDVKESIPLSRIFARVTSDGLVEVDLNKLVDVRCPMDVRRFPFDKQICELQFGSWGFQIHQLVHRNKETFVPEHNVSFGLTTLLTMAVVLDMVTGQMPRSSAGLPLLGRYVLLETLVSIAAMLISVAVMIWNERVISYGRKPPVWIYKLVGDNEIGTDDRVKRLNGNPFRQPLLNNQKKTTEGIDKSNEVIEMLNSLVEYCSELRRADHEKNVWHRFFSLLDLISMLSLVIFNTILTLIAFSSVIFS